MYKILIALSLALTSSPAAAQPISLDIDRMSMITEQAKIICRLAIDLPGYAVDHIERLSAPLKLNPTERLFLLSLCSLYTQGRIDE